MKLHINVDGHATHIKGDTVEQVVETWNWLAQQANERDFVINAKGWSMTQAEQDSIGLITNVPPTMERLLNLGGWTEVDDDNESRIEPLPLPVLSFDEPQPDYTGAAGFAPSHRYAEDVGAPLSLPKLF